MRISAPTPRLCHILVKCVFAHVCVRYSPSCQCINHFSALAVVIKLLSSGFKFENVHCPFQSEPCGGLWIVIVNVSLGLCVDNHVCDFIFLLAIYRCNRHKNPSDGGINRMDTFVIVQWLSPQKISPSPSTAKMTSFKITS